MRKTVTYDWLQNIRLRGVSTLNASGVFQRIPQYAKFGVVGLTATGVHAGVFTLLNELFALEPLAANVIAFGVAVFVSYLGNFHWTFKADPGEGGDDGRAHVPMTFAKFVLVAVTGLILNSAAVYLVMEVMGLPYGYAIIPMVGVVPIIVFALSKFWAFRLAPE